MTTGIRRIGLTALGAAALLLPAVVIGQAVASSPVSGAPSSVADAPTVAEVLEFEAAAAPARDVGSVIASVVESEPSFAYSHIVDQATGAHVVGFRGAVPGPVADALSGEPVTFVENVGFAEADLESYSQSALAAIVPADPAGVTIGLGVDSEARTIEVNVAVDPTVSSITVEALRSDIEAVLSSNPFGYETAIHIVEHAGSGIDFNVGHDGQA